MKKDYTYIRYIPKPLLKDFICNRVVPFVGAGFSKNADIPDGISMSDWNELGKKVASELPDYQFEGNAIDAFSYYEVLYSRSKLVELLMRELHISEINPGKTIDAFCNLFSGTICTTNWDFLLEDSLTLMHKPFSTVVTEDRLSVDPQLDCKILKLHGDFNHPNKMVITENDYDMFLNRNPLFATYVSNLFISNTMLLIGYSLDDNDFRSIWKVINSRLGAMAQPAYVLLVNPSQEQVYRFQRRNIRVINLPGTAKNYKKILYDLFVELNEYITNERNTAAKSTNEKINEQMAIPAEDNRLCFVSCPTNRIAQLSDILYPILRSTEVTPVRPDNMLRIGGSLIDVTKILVQKSRFAIIDITDNNSNSFFDLAFLQSENKDRDTLVIADINSSTPSFSTDHKIVFYSLDPTDDYMLQSFTENVRSWILDRTISDDEYQISNISQTPFENAQRLFKKNEFSACIVSAFSELEYLMRNRRELETKNSIPFRFSTELIRLMDTPSTKEYINLRNRIVHQGHRATKKEAQNVLDFVRVADNYDQSQLSD